MKGGNNELRCFLCKRLLAKHDLKQSTFEVKCTRCGTLNSIFRGITDQVIITDASGRIMYANSMVESVTGYSLSEILGKKPSLWGGQMSQDFYKKIWQKIKVEKKPFAVKVTNKRKDGELYNVILKISPVFDTRGKIMMFVGIETKIS